MIASAICCDELYYKLFKQSPVTFSLCVSSRRAKSYRIAIISGNVSLAGSIGFDIVRNLFYITALSPLHSLHCLSPSSFQKQPI